MIVPIVIFAYNRPTHLKQLVESIRTNPDYHQHPVYIYLDGARGVDDRPQVTAVAQYVSTISGFHQVVVSSSQRNNGLYRNVIRGLTEIFDIYESAIVLEDDLVVSKHFLKYMVNSLELYRNIDAVCSIHGYRYPINAPGQFFLKGADCVGWASWRKYWQKVNFDGKSLRRQIGNSNQLARFNFNYEYNFNKLLRRSESVRNSWAIFWYATMFEQGHYTLYPANSQVIHAGADGSGTNVKITDVFNTSLSATPEPEGPIAVVEDYEAYNQYSRHYGLVSRASFLRSLRYSFERRIEMVSDLLEFRR